MTSNCCPVVNDNITESHQQFQCYYLPHFGRGFSTAVTARTPGGYTMEGEKTQLTQELLTVAEKIGSKDWKRLLRRLGLTESDLDEIRHDYMADGLVEMVYQGLLKWKQQEGKEATLQKLLAGLEMIRRRDVIVKLPADTNIGASELGQIQHDLTGHTVPKQPMSEGIPWSARSKKRKHLPGFLKTLVKSV
ncbi:RIPK1 [Branchiostoma lanceolatum]|uniref:RIPK1 protein n=1 Tax=Branchiostoma lanceolatum TaxID=7740 RepID=A0A8J9YHQ2_BRALA|nr:RIPK1 [Branchiostoma lanceolatum]